ncbi:MAG: adenylosuccinate synthase [Deferribacteraceae bacterium]|jgi:adenylosuccinate synthase|nr:adenylosuccinate synthase [Deferribacteraceae bacterium]
MPCSVVLGSQWGDEGKGKIVDMYAPSADIVMRYQGGHNAGHTVLADGHSYILHLVPSGIIHKGVANLIGNGVVVDPKALLKEIEGLENRGISFKDRFFISDRAHLIFPYHVLIDRLKEDRAGSAKIGTTGLGIGPAYTDKANRSGLRVGDLLDRAALETVVRANVVQYNILAENLYNSETIDAQGIIDEYYEYGKRLRPFIADTVYLANAALKGGKKLLLEGAQGAMLDLDFGTYPFVTSSNGSSGGAAVGSGVSPMHFSKIIGVAKAYCTRVGSGAFPTELKGELGDALRAAGKEFGATTGRARRCGYIDLAALKYAVTVNGITHIALTKLDVLSGIDEIKVCTAYRIDGEESARFPAAVSTLEKAEPVYKSFKGWTQPLTGIARFDDLPKQARDYLAFIKEFLDVEYCVISLGSDRNQSIVLSEAFNDN